MNSTQTVFMPVGLPCAGKTSAMEELMTINGVGENLSIISPDSVRQELYPGYERGAIPFDEIDNGRIFDIVYDRMKDLLMFGWDVWFDAVNTWPDGRLETYEMAESAAADENFPSDSLHYVVISMDVPFDVIAKRNKSCRIGHRVVPIETLEEMHRQKNEGELSLPADDCDVWLLSWNDGKWSYESGFDPPELCAELVNRLNDRFS